MNDIVRDLLFHYKNKNRFGWLSTPLGGAVFNNMWRRRSAIERCPSPRNQIRFCPIVTYNGAVKGNDIYRFSIFRA